MSDGVGAVAGASGGAIGAGGAYGAAGTPAVAPQGNAEGVASAKAPSGKSNHSAESGAGAAINVNITNVNSSFMPSQDFAQLHSTALGKSEGTTLDLRKLIEMMMAIKLLQAMKPSNDLGKL